MLLILTADSGPPEIGIVVPTQLFPWPVREQLRRPGQAQAHKQTTSYLTPQQADCEPGRRLQAPI